MPTSRIAFVLFSIALVMGNAVADETRIISLPTKDIVYDPVSQRIYASVPSSGGAIGNSITRINPFTGTIDTSVFVGSEPGALAISNDGRHIYVSLDGAAAVRRFHVDSLTAGSQFALGSDPFFGPYYAEDIEVQPGQPDVIAVSLKYQGFSPRHAGVAIYENGIKRTNQTPGHTGSNVIEFAADPSRLYGYNNETTEYGFRRMTVNSSGATVLDATPNLFSGFSVDMRYNAGRMYSTTGRVIDPEARILLGTFPLPSLFEPALVAPDSAVNRVFFLTGSEFTPPRMMRSFNPQTFLPVDSVTIDSVSGVASSLIRWGTDGLAFRTDNNQVVILRTSLIPTHVKNHDGEIPSTVSLEQNYPNPFNPSTTIRFSLPKTELVTLTVCNSIGQEVVLLVSETLSSGQHSVNWNASGLSSGVYFYRLRTENGVATKKLVLLR